MFDSTQKSMLSLLAFALAAIPLVAGSELSSTDSSRLRLLKRESSNPYRIYDLNQQLKRSKPYVLYVAANNSHQVHADCNAHDKL